MIASADVATAVARVGRRWEGLRDARLFISGGTGFVGRWLLATLCDANRLLSLNVRAVVLARDARAMATGFRARTGRFGRCQMVRPEWCRGPR